MTKASIGAAAAIAVLALPGAAMARGGGGDVAPAPTPDAGPACGIVEALNSGVIDKIGSRKPITLDFKLTNCSLDRVATVRTTLVPTALTVRSLDPFVQDTCTGAAYSAQQLTLKPRESRTISATAAVPFCGVSQWGINGYDVQYDVTASDAADGTVLSTTTSYVLHRGGV